MMIDSLEMTEEDRELVARHCETSEENQIVITHGTDTMTDTAKILAEKIHGKTIVLTGAMVPYKFGSSDGLFNLGSALAFVQTLPEGVYIAMNGKCFNWSNVRKNKQTGMFEELG
jgi:L-asparaginase